jgi:hypothetical protein
MVRCAENPDESMRIRAIACIEPSLLVDGGESGGDNVQSSVNTYENVGPN